MNAPLIFRQLYAPIQPGVKQSENGVTYQEFLPDVRLQSIIYTYWQLKTNFVLPEPFTYRVVADGCIDIFFDLNNPEDSLVMGFSNKYAEFNLGCAFNYVGIRFLPTFFPQLFNINASELSNHLTELQVISTNTFRFIQDKFIKEKTPAEIQDIFNFYFLSLLLKVELNTDPRMYRALDVLIKSPGNILIETDLETGISSRQLRRLFHHFIGDTPKAFSKVVRFQKILQANPSLQSLKLDKLYYDYGFFDQAHFIKDFKNLYGITPGKAFNT